MTNIIKLFGEIKTMDILEGLKNTTYIDKGLAEYYQKQNRYDLSIEYCKKIIETTLNIQNLIENLEEISPEYESEIKTIIEETNQKLVSLHYYYAEEKFKKQEWENALNLYKYVLTSSSNNPFIFYRTGICFKNLGEVNSTIFWLEKALDYPETHHELAFLYYQKGNFSKATTHYENSLSHYPKNDYVHNMLGLIYNLTGKIEKSYSHLQEANKLTPSSELIISNLLFTLQKIPNKTQEEISQVTSSLINKYKEIKNIVPYQHSREITEGKKLNIAYISGDFNEHVIMLYLLPILENHNKDNFTVTCYSNSPEEDDDIFTVRAEMQSDNFKNVSQLSIAETAKLIYEDQIDILIDLSGHTARTKVFVGLYKPAPIQVSYMGFPHTTGMVEFEYFLTNKNLNQVEENSYYAEQLYFLDSCYRCFKPAIEIPEVIEAIPQETTKYITFGVFNDLSKINDKVIKVWSEILKRLPSSKLFICRNTIIEEFLLAKFAEFGISEDRLILDKVFDPDKYHLIDLHLDTFPYCGVTVIFDSLIRGVPTLTLLGDSFAGKEAANINQYLGLTDFIAYSETDYINKAIELSQNQDKLKHLKKNLANTYQKSDFNNHKAFTESLETSYQDMWKKYLVIPKEYLTIRQIK